MSFDPAGLTPQFLRVARALLNWSAEDLADKAHVGVATVRRAELSQEFIKKMKPETAAKMVQTLERAGVVFLEKGKAGGRGVRLKR